MNKELEKRLQQTEEKGVFKDPDSGALIFRHSKKEKDIATIPKLTKRMDAIEDKLDLILKALT